MIKQFRDKSINELQALVANWKAELLALRFQQATGQLEKPHKFRELRLSVARALTIINEKQKNGEVATKETKKEKAPRVNPLNAKVEKQETLKHTETKKHVETKVEAKTEKHETPKHTEVKKHVETKTEKHEAAKHVEVKKHVEAKTEKHEPTKHVETKKHEATKAEDKKEDISKQPATAAQVALMKKMKLDFDEKTLTKKQAMFAIAKAKKATTSKGEK